MTIAQSGQGEPRYRVIIDNDFGGDPDGLLDLAHALLSTTLEIRAIIASAHFPVFPATDDPAASAVAEATHLMDVMGIKNRPKVYKGSNDKLKPDAPVDDESARVIIAEAHRKDSQLPLYVLCGGSLKAIANAWLLDSTIVDKLTVIWIGGSEYDVPADKAEHNLAIAITAAQVIFNQSNICLWQVPKDAYDQTVMSKAELAVKVGIHGKAGKHLEDRILARMNMLSGYFRGETYTMGDNPLTLLCALQAFYSSNPSSSKYTERKAPFITDQGLYRENPQGRNIRVFTRLDTRLMFDDLEAKLLLWSRSGK